MIGKVIKYMRQKNNISQEKLSLLTNIGRSTISDYEREKTDINFENIERIAQICGYQVVFKSKDNKEEFSAKEIERKI